MDYTWYVCITGCAIGMFWSVNWVRWLLAWLTPEEAWGLMPLSPPLQFPGGELGLPCAEPFPLPGKKATPPAPTAPVALELWSANGNALNAFSCIWPDILTFSGNGGIGGPRGWNGGPGGRRGPWRGHAHLSAAGGQTLVTGSSVHRDLRHPSIHRTWADSNTHWRGGTWPTTTRETCATL